MPPVWHIRFRKNRSSVHFRGQNCSSLCSIWINDSTVCSFERPASPIIAEENVNILRKSAHANKAADSGKESNQQKSLMDMCFNENIKAVIACYPESLQNMIFY